MEQIVTELSKEEISRAITNEPTEHVIVLGGREFAIKDLPYEDYLRFLFKLQPMLEMVVGKIANLQGIGVIQESTLSPVTLLQYCGEVLPELVSIVCKQTAPGITEEEIKIMCPSPFKMASVVLAQIHQNRMISDFADFFGQMLPLMSAMKSGSVEKPKKSKTKATR